MRTVIVRINDNGMYEIITDAVLCSECRKRSDIHRKHYCFVNQKFVEMTDFCSDGEKENG